MFIYENILVCFYLFQENILVDMQIFNKRNILVRKETSDKVAYKPYIY